MNLIKHHGNITQRLFSWENFDLKMTKQCNKAEKINEFQSTSNEMIMMEFICEEFEGEKVSRGRRLDSNYSSSAFCLK